MNNLPTLSVIMCVYNCERYVGKAVKSILGQTITDLELIIVNDGSTDDTKSIVKSFRDSRIKYVEWKENHGVAAASTEGLSLARGQYVARMDADDIALARKFDVQLRYLKTHPKLDIVGCWWVNINEDGKILGLQPLPVNPDACAFMAMVLGNQPVGNSCAVYTRAVVKELKEFRQGPGVGGEDVDFYLRADAAGFFFGNVPQPLLLYRIHSTQLSTAKALLQQQDHTWALQSYLKSYGVVADTPGDDLTLYDRYWREREICSTAGATSFVGCMREAMLQKFAQRFGLTSAMTYEHYLRAMLEARQRIRSKIKWAMQTVLATRSLGNSYFQNQRIGFNKRALRVMGMLFASCVRSVQAKWIILTMRVTISREAR